MEVKSILSEKGRPLLVVNNYKFCLANVSKKNITRWRCANKTTNCSANLYTRSDDYEVVVGYKIAHNHKAIKNLQRQALSNSIKRRAQTNLHEHPKKIIHEEIRLTDRLYTDITAHDVDRIRRNVYKSQRNLLPAPPVIENRKLEFAYDRRVPVVWKATRPESTSTAYIIKDIKIIPDAAPSSSTSQSISNDGSSVLRDNNLGNTTTIKQEIDETETKISVAYILNDIPMQLEAHNGDDTIQESTEDVELNKSETEYTRIKEEIPEEPEEHGESTSSNQQPNKDNEHPFHICPSPFVALDQQPNEDGEHPIQTFFKSMAATVMTFPPHLMVETRMKVCQLVCEMEMRLLKEQSEQTSKS